MNRPTIEIRSLSKRFGETQALARCDFTAYPGEVHAIVGENGSGKSTLAKIISGVISSDAGTMAICGGSIGSPTEARASGVVTIFQEVLVADEASILDNLFVGHDGLVSRGSEKDRANRADEILVRLLGQKIDLNRPVGKLPLSLKQWIVIARALLCEPKVLILDESSAALDLEATERLHAEIERLRLKGCTVLIVTHRIAELVRIADRATILRDGTTVGVLERGEISEERLLELMTPSTRERMQQPIVRACDGKFGRNFLSVSAPKSGGEKIFEIASGEIVGLAGLEGHGQSEFAMRLAGIATGSGLSVEVLDRLGSRVVMNSLKEASENGIIWVSGDRRKEGIFSQQSIFDNFAIGVYKKYLGFLGTIDRRSTRRLFDREVRRLSIKLGSPHNKITSLSGGNQQKVLIARTFANDPRIIVLNDPARGVDQNTKNDLYRELTSFADAGGSVVYLSSEIEEFIGFADRVDVFRNGGIFSSLRRDEINEGDMLAAMFGKPSSRNVSPFNAEVRRA